MIVQTEIESGKQFSMCVFCLKKKIGGQYATKMVQYLSGLQPLANWEVGHTQKTVVCDFPALRNNRTGE